MYICTYTHTERCIYIAEHIGPYGEGWDIASLLLALTSLNSDSFKHAKATPSRAIMEKKIKDRAVFIYLEPNKSADVFCWVIQSLSWGRISLLVWIWVIWDMVCTEVDSSPTPNGDLIAEQSSKCNKNPSSLWSQHLKNYTLEQRDKHPIKLLSDCCNKAVATTIWCSWY